MRKGSAWIARASVSCFLVSVAACGPPDDGASTSSSRLAGSADYTAADSAGVIIVVTGGGGAYTPLEWSVSPTPDLHLGDGPDRDGQFHQVRGVAPLPDGGVAVLDGSSRELRFYDRRGNHVMSTGRQGAGPGEFERPALVRSPLADSLLVYDGALRRFTWHSRDGAGMRHMTDASRQVGGRPPVGALEAGVLIERSPTIILEERQFGPQTHELTYLWVDLLSGAEVPLRSYTVTNGFRYPPDPKAGQVHPVLRHIPFAARPAAVVSSRGAMLTSGSEFEILEFDVAGSLSQVLRVESRRRPVTRRDIQAVIDRELDGLTLSRRPYARQFAEMPLPDSMPAFVSLRIDELGWLWAQLYHEDPRLSSVWMVFDPDGRARGTVELPAGLNVHHIGEDHVLGVWIGEERVEHVRRHALVRD